MNTSLRKMGDTVGIILPKAPLNEFGAGADALMGVCIEAGAVIATPVRRLRKGWAEDAIVVAAAEEDPDEAAWCAFGNDGDAELTW